MAATPRLCLPLCAKLALGRERMISSHARDRRPVAGDKTTFDVCTARMALKSSARKFGVGLEWRFLKQLFQKNQGIRARSVFVPLYILLRSHRKPSTAGMPCCYGLYP